MFDLGDYVTIKIWAEYIIPVVIFILFFGILFIRGFAEDRRLHKNVELLEKYGYTKSTHLSYRFGGGGVGKPTTVWTKYNHTLTEHDLKHMSYAELKTAIENADKDGDLNDED